jgi:hypothetical protein
MTTALILAADGVIVTTAASYTVGPNGITTPDGIYPYSAGITGVATVDTLPTDFDTRWYRWRDGALAYDMPAEILEQRRSALRARLAERRWRAETRGVAITGFDARIDTSRESQAMMSGALLAGQYSVVDTFDWKIGPGVWVEITNAQLVVIASAVAAHVQACFSNERAIENEITAAMSIADLNAIDINAGWPE